LEKGARILVKRGRRLKIAQLVELMREEILQNLNKNPSEYAMLYLEGLRKTAP
jgi:hypothetical protein